MKVVEEVQRLKRSLRKVTVVLLCILFSIASAFAEEVNLAELKELSREQLEIPIYLADQPTKVISQTLLTVTNERELIGVIAPSGSGSYGTIANLSKPDAEFLQISPDQTLKVNSLAATRCGEISQAPMAIAKMISTKPTSAWREFRLFVVASAEFSRNRPDGEIAAQVVASVAAANLFMESLEIKVALAGIQIIRPSQDPFRVATDGQNAYQALDLLRSEWRERADVARDGVAYFATGKYGGTFGLAYTGSSCVSPENSVIFASQGGLGPEAELSLAATLAHELGHVLGMSHDHKIYSTGPSLMYPMFTMSPSGFSPFSVDQFLNHAGVGQAGGICLKSVAAPSELQLEGGSSEIVKLREGQTFRRRIRLSNGTSPFTGLANRLNLASGMKFDANAGVFLYRPDFTTASIKEPTVEQRVELDLVLEDGRLVRKQFIFVVRDVNRAPRFARAPKKLNLAKRGSSSRFTWRVTDLDGDTVSFTKQTLRALRALPGRKDIRVVGNELRLRFRVGFSGTRQVRIVARDSAGRAVSRTFVIQGS